MAAKRENFSGRFAIIMAMAGSAIGLGNIWRFPWLVGQCGGAAFIIVYLISTIVLSIPVFLAESVIGRSTQLGTFGAMEKLAPGTKWKWLGLLTIIATMILLSYYSVVGGWSVEYLCKSLTFSFNASSKESMGSMFANFISHPLRPLVCHTIFLLMTALIVANGVKSGIERFSKITIPILFILIIIIIVYSVTLPGAKGGIDYLVKPDFSKLNASTIAAAMGQSFFSLSLGVGCILTYSSYIRKDENLVVSGTATAFSDLLFAVLAGMAIIPAVFAAGIEPGSGPGLVFETLPFVFGKLGESVGWISDIMAILFFLAVLLAALTSAISMLEICVAYLVEERKMSRKKATWVLFFVMWLIGSLCSLSFGPLSDFKILGCTIFDFCDKLISNYMMTFGALLFTIFVGWVMPKNLVKDEITGGGTQKAGTACFNTLYFIIKWLAPILIAIVFVTNLVM